MTAAPPLSDTRDHDSDRVWSALHRILGRGLAHGRLCLEVPGGRCLEIGALGATPTARMRLRSLRALRRVVTGGALGLAEGYMAGDWDSPDLTALLMLLDRNRESFRHLLRGGRLPSGLHRLRHVLRANTRRGSRRNIAAHYDLGNDFYAAWLDASMTYSSALYATGVKTLEEAQQAKIERVASLLEPAAGDRILEIGCGWGALMEHLAAAHGCQVQGLTLSNRQLAYAARRLDQASLADRARPVLTDYRDASGLFDGVVSIEMIEAVGERRWPAYFRCLHDRLKPGGRAVIQAITISDARFPDYRRGVDFIQRYVFPGGMLPTETLMRHHAEGAGLRQLHAEHFGSSYARTLADWRARFLEAWPSLRAQGFDDHFRRLWTYYLCYCEAGFRRGTIDVGLYVYGRADAP